MIKIYWRIGLMLCAAILLAGAGALRASAATTTAAGGGRASRLGTVSGTVLDSRGNPVAGAVVKILRDGFNEVVKETKSGADGSFAARLVPGRYLIRALADGFAPATFTAVQVSPATELVYKFNLQPAGEGRTAPERRADRHDPKFRIRASQARRSVFNAGDAEDETVRRVLEELAEVEQASEAEGELEVVAHEEEKRERRPRTQGYVETFFADSAIPGAGSYAGVNFAVATPVNRSFDMIFSGQLGEFERLEATARIRAGARHRLSASLGGALLPLAPNDAAELGGARAGLDAARGEKLGQVSARVVDEWVVRDGVVLVLGLDYSRFLGAGGADSFSPRIGVAFDANARTRFHASFSPGSDTATRVGGVEFEDGEILFKENAGQAIAVVDGQAVLERSSRLEFGVERILDERSSVEATAFLDTVQGRGVGLMSVPAGGLTKGGSAALLSVANQQGGARGVRVVYTRRVSQHLRASAAYAFGHGQRLSGAGQESGPERLFQNAFFQTAAAQLDADVLNGTRVRTVLRFSPSAAVFAIDPFAGRLAVYDPSLSIQVTQELPNFGLPVRAQATIDARNLLDVLTRVEDADGGQVSLGALRRSLRGGISLRF